MSPYLYHIYNIFKKISMNLVLSLKMNLRYYLSETYKKGDPKIGLRLGAVFL